MEIEYFKLFLFFVFLITRWKKKKKTQKDD